MTSSSDIELSSMGTLNWGAHICFDASICDTAGGSVISQYYTNFGEDFRDGARLLFFWASGLFLTLRSVYRGLKEAHTPVEMEVVVAKGVDVAGQERCHHKVYVQHAAIAALQCAAVLPQARPDWHSQPFTALQPLWINAIGCFLIS